MQVLFILGVSCGVLGAFPPHYNFAAGFLFQLFLVVALGTYQQTCIVKITVLGQNNFSLDFGGVVHHGEDAGVESHGEILPPFDQGESDAQVLVGWVQLLHQREVLDFILGPVEVEVQFGGQLGGLGVYGLLVLFMRLVLELALPFLRKW